MKKHEFLIGTIFLALFFLDCSETGNRGHYGEVGIQVKNNLGVKIDTFDFNFETSAGEDSIVLFGLADDQTSSLFFYDDIIYHFREKDDVFFIGKGIFIIEGRVYYLSNCFCDPDLETSEISEGILTVLITGIDEARGNIEYSVLRE
jgi:hypothetical protein